MQGPQERRPTASTDTYWWTPRLASPMLRVHALSLSGGGLIIRRRSYILKDPLFGNYIWKNSIDNFTKSAIWCMASAAYFIQLRWSSLMGRWHPSATILRPFSKAPLSPDRWSHAGRNWQGRWTQFIWYSWARFPNGHVAYQATRPRWIYSGNHLWCL